MEQYIYKMRYVQEIKDGVFIMYVEVLVNNEWVFSEYFSCDNITK